VEEVGEEDRTYEVEVIAGAVTEGDQAVRGEF
jgi:hypothetical protein